MILLAGSSDFTSTPSTLTDVSRRTPDRERDPRHQAWTPPDASCLRCGGLLVLSYMAALESDLSGRPMRLWRCVNCGDCIDHDILTNRWNGPVPAREPADARAHLVFPPPVTNGVFEVRRLKTDEAKTHALTGPREQGLAAHAASHERSSRHG